MGKGKLLADYALKGVSFWWKRRTATYPDRIENVVVDLDYTLINALTAYKALEKVFGVEGAKAAYQEQKKRVKSGKANFADVKFWGHQQQLAKGWTDRDWKNVLDECVRDGKLNTSLVESLRAIQHKRPDVRIILTTGTSSVIGSRLAAYLRQQYGIRVNMVVGSTQQFGPRNRLGVVGKGPRAGRVVYGNSRPLDALGRFVGESHSTIPTVEKIPAIEEAFRGRGQVFNPKTAVAISDADPELLRHCGIGVLIPVSKSEDPASFVSTKFKLRDVESADRQRQAFIEQLVLNPKIAIALASKKVNTPAGKVDALTHHLETKPREPLPVVQPKKPSVVARMFKRR